MEIENAETNNGGYSTNEQEQEDFIILFNNDRVNIPVVRNAHTISRFGTHTPNPRLPNPHATTVTGPGCVTKYHDPLPLDKTVLDYDITTFPDPVWRKPLQDSSDYFNYGRDEYSWWRFAHYIISGDAEHKPNIQNVKGAKGAKGRVYGIPRQVKPPFDSRALFSVGTDSLEKPWLIPGADSSHFFNYDHDAQTWHTYRMDALDRILNPQS